MGRCLCVSECGDIPVISGRDTDAKELFINGKLYYYPAGLEATNPHYDPWRRFLVLTETWWMYDFSGYFQPSYKGGTRTKTTARNRFTGEIVSQTETYSAPGMDWSTWTAMWIWIEDYNLDSYRVTNPSATTVYRKEDWCTGPTPHGWTPPPALVPAGTILRYYEKSLSQEVTLAELYTHLNTALMGISFDEVDSMSPLYRIVGFNEYGVNRNSQGTPVLEIKGIEDTEPGSGAPGPNAFAKVWLADYPTMRLKRYNELFSSFRKVCVAQKTAVGPFTTEPKAFDFDRCIQSFGEKFSGFGLNESRQPTKTQSYLSEMYLDGNPSAPDCCGGISPPP